jgi:hypothetical protein
MQRRYLIIASALVLSLALAVPTIGAQNNTSALKTAKEAKRIAKTAKSKSQAAKRSANTANVAAGEAREVADSAQARIDALAAVTDSKPATVTTGNEVNFQDRGGPSVTVNVPESGTVEVWAQVTMADGLVSLFQDGQQVPRQDPNDICGPITGTLLSVQGGPAVTLATPGGFNFIGCGSLGAPSPVVFQTTPGEHTFSLRYADCGCDPEDAEFSDRTLSVAPRP